MAYVIPPDTRTVGSGNPPVDMDNVADVLSGSPLVKFNVLNTAWAGGADPTGVNDSTAAIQAALTAAGAGGVTYLPPGTYLTTAPLSVPSGVTLLGSHAAEHDVTPAILRLSAGFSGAAAITFPAWTGEQAVTAVTIDGSLPSAGTVAGIAATAGEAQFVQLRDLLITGAGISNGISLQSGAGIPLAWTAAGIVVLNISSDGFLLQNAPDGTWTNCVALGCGGDGWYIVQCGNSRFIYCRSEWSANGWHIGGAWGSGTGSGGCQFIGCSTDRNSHDGVLVDASSGNMPMLFAGLMCRRDGASSTSGGYAALHCSNTTIPVAVDGMSCYPGVNDDGSGNDSPQYGISLTGTNTYVAATNAYLHAVTAGVNGSGLNSRAVTTRTGPTASPSGVTEAADADGGGGGTVTSVTAGDTSIVVGGSGAAPTIETATLDVIAADHPAAADWSNNSHKITSLANGSNAQDAAAFGQIPLIDSTAGDIQPVGTQSAGSTGKPADAGHVHSISSGLAPLTSGFTAFGTGGMINELNMTSGASTAMTAGTIYYGALWIPFNVTLTGIVACPGNTGTTDSWIAALYNSAGTLLANSATGGITVGAANTKQKFVFTGTVNVTGPAVYLIGIQSNGTHANLLCLNNSVEGGFVTGTKTGNSFGTLTLGTPAASYTAGVAPFANTY